MPFPVFLAMTAAEIRGRQAFPGRIGWMSCLFSPYGTGLSNFPRTLPPGALLILSDYTPMQGHDPEYITQQLLHCIETFCCSGLLLDFQRPQNEDTAILSRMLAEALPCPVAVPEMYALDLDCGVFLPPVMPSAALKDYLAPWQGREIWLELSLNGEIITLTETGAEAVPLPRFVPPEGGFAETDLHCHYRIETAQDKAAFTLWRTREDVAALLEEAEGYGVTAGVGLYQEFGSPIQIPANELR